MNETNNSNSIIVSDEFKILVQDLTPDNIALLKAKFGNPEYHPILPVWNGYLLSDFQLYKLCQDSSIQIEFEEHQFQSKEHAQSWVCSSQLKRYDLSDEYKKYLIGKKYSLEIECQKKELAQLFENNPNENITITQNSNTKIGRELVNELGIKFGTLQKYNVYSKALDHLISIKPEFAKLILTGVVKVSHSNLLRLTEQPKEVIEKIMNYTEENKITHLGYSELTSNLQWKDIQQSQSQKQIEEEPKIRQMPAYDPDAEISSMALTIPSWVSSMERAHKRTDYSKTSMSAKINLVKQLAILERTIYIIQKEIEEAF